MPALGDRIKVELYEFDKTHRVYKIFEDHPRIQKTEESFIPFNQLELDLNNLKKLINENKANEVKKFLDNTLKLYKSNSQIVDSIYTQQLFSSSLQKNSQLNEEKK